MILEFHFSLLVELTSDKKSSSENTCLTICHLLEQGFAATRLFEKKICIVHKMNKEVLPSIQSLDALVKEKKVKIKGFLFLARGDVLQPSVNNEKITVIPY